MPDALVELELPCLGDVKLTGPQSLPEDGQYGCVDVAGVGAALQLLLQNEGALVRHPLQCLNHAGSAHPVLSDLATNNLPARAPVFGGCDAGCWVLAPRLTERWNTALL